MLGRVGAPLLVVCSLLEVGAALRVGAAPQRMQTGVAQHRVPQPCMAGDDRCALIDLTAVR